MTRSERQENPRIFGKLIQTDEYTNVSRAYACGAFVSACAIALTNPSPNPIAVGEQTEVDVLEVMACTGDGPCSCNDGCGSASTSGVITWGTDNSNILSLDSSYPYAGIFEGRGTGDTFADASVIDSQNCSGHGGMRVTVVANKCFAQLKYRAVEIVEIEVGNHSYWWLQDGSLQTWVMDAGPSGNCLPNCGYLDSWIVPGDVGHITQDDARTDSVAWASPVSGSVCSNSTNLITFEENWPQDTTSYGYGTAPNSNTWAHRAADAAPFTITTPPPDAPGW